MSPEGTIVPGELSPPLFSEETIFDKKYLDRPRFFVDGISKNHKYIWELHFDKYKLFQRKRKKSRNHKNFITSLVLFFETFFYFINIWRRTKTNMVIVYHRATFNIKLGIGGHVLDFSSRLSSENPDRKIWTTDRTKKSRPKNPYHVIYPDWSGFSVRSGHPSSIGLTHLGSI